MLRDTNSDFITFFICAVLGAALCVVYDVIKIVRRSADSSAVAMFFQDIIFFIFAGLVTFFSMLTRTSGEIRWFVFGGELAGFILCRFTLSRLIAAVSDAVIKFFRLVFSPVFRLIRYIFGKLLSVFDFLFKKSEFFAKKLLQPIHIMMYNIANRLFIRNISDNNGKEE